MNILLGMHYIYTSCKVKWALLYLTLSLEVLAVYPTLLLSKS